MHVSRYLASAATALGLFLLVSSLPASAQAPNAFIGTWVLDTDRSIYQPEAIAPDRRILVLETAEGGVRYTTRTWRPGNRTDFREVSYVARLDGTEVTLRSNGARVMLTQPDAVTIELHAMADHGAMDEQMWELSEDGQMLTITGEGRDTFGNAFHSTQVYHRDDLD